jgi:hypothetical protein
MGGIVAFSLTMVPARQKDRKSLIEPQITVILSICPDHEKKQQLCYFLVARPTWRWVLRNMFNLGNGAMVFSVAPKTISVWN